MAEWKAKALAISPKVSGIISFFSSAMIVFNIITLPKMKQQQVYTRLILAISCFDVLTSLHYFFATWPIPKDAGPLYAAGNQHTCTIQGFVIQFGFAVPGLNTSLAIYYWAVLVLKWNDRKIRKYLALPLLAVPIALALILASIGLYMKLYNSANLWCWVASVPAVCGGDTGIECERGQGAPLFRWLGFYVPLWMCIVFVTVLMINVFINVRQTEKISAAYRAQNQSMYYSSDLDDDDVDEDVQGKESNGTDDDHDNRTTSGDSKNTNASDNGSIVSRASSILAVFRRKKKKSTADKDLQLRLNLTRKVFWQSIFYVLAFYISWIFPTILRLFQAFQKPAPYPIVLLAAIFLPFQGFFNAFIYFRPRLVYWNNRRIEEARKRKQAINNNNNNNGNNNGGGGGGNQQQGQSRISSVTLGSLIVGNIAGENDIPNDQVGDLEMDSNPAYALSLATSVGIPERKLVGYKRHETLPPIKEGNEPSHSNDALSGPLNVVNTQNAKKKDILFDETCPMTEENDSSGSGTGRDDTKNNDNKNVVTTNNTEPQTSTTTMKLERNLVKELEESMVLRIKGGSDFATTCDVYDILFGADQQPSFDAIYQLPPPPNSINKEKPKVGLTLYGDLCHVFEVSLSLSNNDDDDVWNSQENVECRERVGYELDGLTTILIVDLQNHTLGGQERWKQFVDPLVLLGDVRVVALVK